MDNIIIVGGGTSGLVSALILKCRFPKLNIEVIRSDKLGIIGVGEGSTEHWGEFCAFVGITVKDLLLYTGATFKYGIMFEDWNKKPYFHGVEENVNAIKYGQYMAGYAYAIINDLKSKQYTTTACFDNKISPNNLPNQFHFNTFKLNEFLLKKCVEKNINIINDEIVKINIKKETIQSIESKKKRYKADFFIDSTGFKKLLISKLGAKWTSYQKYLPMNEAIAFPTPDPDEYTPYTLSKAMSSGWLWRIPTQGRCGNGYVFNNKYIDAEQAKKECEKYLGHKIEIGKNIKFEAGALDRAWIGNCVAVGLSSSFIEPLEASSIGTSIQQAFLLMHFIINYQETDIELYNTRFKNIVENTRDFVLLHYLTGKKDSKFWKEFKPDLPESLSKNLKKWKHRLPIQEDFSSVYNLFGPHNFAILLKELNLVDKKSIKKEYDMLSDPIKFEVDRQVSSMIDHDNNNRDIKGHKGFLKELSLSPLEQPLWFYRNDQLFPGERT